MSEKLVFRNGPATSGRLVFGDQEGGGDVDIPPLDLVLDGLMPDLEINCLFEYRSDAQRPIVSATSGAWQRAGVGHIGITTRVQYSVPAPTGWQSRWQRTAGAPSGAEHRLPHLLLPLRAGPVARHQQACSLPQSVSMASQVALRESVTLAGLFECALSSRLRVDVGHQDGLRDRRPSAAGRAQSALPWIVGLGTDFQPGAPMPVGWVARHQNAMQPRVGTSRPYVPPPPDPDPGNQPCYVPDPRLVFRNLAILNGKLVFLCPRQGPGPSNGVILPIRRIYIVLNNVTIHRVDTGAELRAHSFGMSLDYQSWTWSWQASLHHDAAAHLGRDNQGAPAELAITINGLPFRLRLERVTRDRRFNPTRWGVSGKGKASILNIPYAPAMSFGNPLATRTAQQLMADVLTINGVDIGWSVDWHLQDWLVPAGAWAMQGSYIDAINDIAATAGGYVQPHPTDSVLRILPRYPAASWAWGDIIPDFEIPADAAEVEGTEYIDQPAYNRVFLGGIGAGVFGPFTRAGTAGDVIAPQVTHALMTDAVVHRQRGLAELSNTGRQEHITLNMQVLPETGVIVPGQFVRYLGDKTMMGIVRSTSIDWSAPKLRQTIKLETHA